MDERERWRHNAKRNKQKTGPRFFFFRAERRWCHGGNHKHTEGTAFPVASALSSWFVRFSYDRSLLHAIAEPPEAANDHNASPQINYGYGAFYEVWSQEDVSWIPTSSLSIPKHLYVSVCSYLYFAWKRMGRSRGKKAQNQLDEFPFSRKLYN